MLLQNKQFKNGKRLFVKMLCKNVKIEFLEEIYLVFDK